MMPVVAAAQDTVDATTLAGKYMFGYQGWFRCPNDGSGGGWFHWFRGQDPSAADLNVEMYPDLSEFDSDELFNTSMHYANGNPAALYSAYTEKTVLRHFKWMKDYGLHGVWVQRFGPRHTGWTEFTNKVLLNCKKGAETYGRVFVVMYDISGANNATLFDNITRDWMYLVDTFKITESPRYLRHKGRPMVSVWGFGFDDRSITADVAARIVKWFKTDAPARYRVTFMGGVHDSWRTIAAPWDSVCRSVDVISPWMVGRFGDTVGANSWKVDRLVPDIAEARRIGKDYLPVVWPGFSWYNLKLGASPQNKIPRRGGAFLWKQICNCMGAGCSMIYNAMFDEVDESTAMFKVCPKRSLAPKEGYWLTLDADGHANLPSDWYLRLAACGTKMVARQIPFSCAMPLNPNKPDSGLVAAEKSSRTVIRRCFVSVKNRTITVTIPSGSGSHVSLCRPNGAVIRFLSSSACSGGEETVRLTPAMTDGLAEGVYLLNVRLEKLNYSESVRVYIR